MLEFSTNFLQAYLKLFLKVFLLGDLRFTFLLRAGYIDGAVRVTVEIDFN